MKTIIEAILRYLALIFMYYLAGYVFKIRNRVKVIGRKNLPRRLRTLLVSKHETLIDSLLIGWATTNLWQLFFRQRYIAWNAPDRKNFLDHGFSKFFFGLLKNIPTDRDIKTKAGLDHQIDSYCQVLDVSNLLIFFAGQRSRDGSIGECKKGVAITILRARPNYVVPINLIGIAPIMPINVGFNYRKISSGHRGKIIIGKPIDFSEIIESDLTEKTKIELICKKIEEAVGNTQP